MSQTQTDPSAEAREHLAQRFGNLIYAAALRQARDQHAARDIAQAVFLIALQKAQTGHLPEESRMAGWLLKITHYAVKESRRREEMRSRHESHAAAMHTPPEALDQDQETLLAALDQALLKLPGLDRELIARRYLQNQPVNHLAAALNIPENTASQRLGRALEKLRKLLTRQGTILPAAALTTLLLAESTKAAPASLLTAASTTGSTTAAVSIAKGATAMLKLATLKTGSLAMATLVLLGILGAAFPMQARTQAAAPTSQPPPSLAAAPAPAKPAEVIDAAALVREVRQKEEWIETTPSVYVKATWTETSSPQSIANSHQWNIEWLAREKEALDRAADAKQPPPPPLTDTPAIVTKNLEIAFDARRTLFREWSPGRDWINIWNGTTGFGYLQYPEHSYRQDFDAAGKPVNSGDTPVQSVETIVDSATDVYFVGLDSGNNPMTEFFWPIAAPHRTWFAEQLTAEPNLVVPLAIFGGKTPAGATARPDGNVEFTPPDPGEFVYLRTEKVRGIDCYVLLQSDDTYRWSIGVQDHLLHRYEKGTLPNPDHWKIYVAEAQKQGATITSEKSLNEWLGSLDENERQRLHYGIENEYKATAKAWIEYSFADYVEAKPGKWFPRTQSMAYHDIHRFDGKQWVDDYEHAFETFRHEIKVSDLRVDDPLPDSLFAMEIPEGAKVAEDIDGTRVEYPYKKNMTAAEKAAIVEKVREQQELRNRMTEVAIAVNDYAFKQSAERKWPASLGATLPLVRTDGAEEPAAGKARAATYLSPEDQKNLVIPDNPTADWVDQHTSFVYLGKDVLVSNIPKSAWSRTVMLHEKMELAHPAKEKVRLVFADLHNEMVIPDLAAEVIESSKKILAAARVPEAQDK